MYNHDDDQVDRDQQLDALLKHGQLAQALELLEAWFEREPWRSELLMRLAVVHWLAGEPARTLHDLDAFLALEPDNAEALARRAQALLMLGKRKDAEASLGRAEAIDPGTPGVLLNRALLLEEDGEFDLAIASLSDYLAVVPQDHLALARRSHLFRLLGYYPRALEDALACVAMRPDDPETHFAEALARITLEQGQEALNACDRCLQLHAAFLPALRVKIDLLADLGELDQAETVLAQLETTDPDSAPTLLLRARMAAGRERYPQALEWIEQYLENAPDEPYGYYRRGMIYYGMMDYARALADFQQYAHLAPRALEAYEQQFLCYLALGQYPQAVQVSRIAYDLQPQNFRVCYNLGFAQLLCEQTDEALAGFSAALALEPANEELLIRIHLALTDHASPETRRSWFTTAEAEFGARSPLLTGLLADIHLDAGEYEEALRLARAVLAANPQHPYGYLLAIKALSLLDRYPEARAQADAGIALLPDDGRLRVARAMLARDSGNTDDALRELDIAARLLPGDAEVPLQQALTYAGDGRVKQAAQLLKQAQALDTSRTDIRFWLGYFLLHLRRYRESLQVADELLTLAPGGAGGNLLRGAALRGVGEDRQADEEFARAQRYEPALLARLLEDPVIAELQVPRRAGRLEHWWRALISGWQQRMQGEQS